MATLAMIVGPGVGDADGGPDAVASEDRVGTGLVEPPDAWATGRVDPVGRGGSGAEPASWPPMMRPTATATMATTVTRGCRFTAAIVTVANRQRPASPGPTVVRAKRDYVRRGRAPLARRPGAP